MLVDEANIVARAGNGGDGCISFRREKYTPRGGPDGGNGGDGGDVVLQVDQGLGSLRSYQSRRHFKGENGENGKGRKKHGRNGKDLVLKVPPGTAVHDKSNKLVADLLVHEQRLVVARGGRGGRGNIHFATASDRTPHRAEPGAKGEKRELRLELRLLVDVGIVGFPNAGRSTLLSKVSNIEPRIAGYPFTTTSPLPAVAELEDGTRLTLVEIPAIFEGSHRGKGLGLEHLKHAQRAKALLFLLDPSQGDPNAQYEILKAEIGLYDPELLEKPRVVALNKADLASGELQVTAEADSPVHCISALRSEGLASLLRELARRVEWEKRGGDRARPKMR